MDEIQMPISNFLCSGNVVQVTFKCDNPGPIENIDDVSSTSPMLKEWGISVKEGKTLKMNLICVDHAGTKSVPISFDGKCEEASLTKLFYVAGQIITIKVHFHLIWKLNFQLPGGRRSNGIVCKATELIGPKLGYRQADNLRFSLPGQPGVDVNCNMPFGAYRQFYNTTYVDVEGDSQQVHFRID